MQYFSFYMFCSVGFGMWGWISYLLIMVLPHWWVAFILIAILFIFILSMASLKPFPDPEKLIKLHLRRAISEEFNGFLKSVEEIEDESEKKN